MGGITAVGTRPKAFGRVMETLDLPAFLAAELQHNRHYRTLVVCSRVAPRLGWNRCRGATPLRESLIEIVKEIARVFDPD